VQEWEVMEQEKAAANLNGKKKVVSKKIVESHAAIRKKKIGVSPSKTKRIRTPVSTLSTETSSDEDQTDVFTMQANKKDGSSGITSDKMTRPSAFMPPMRNPIFKALSDSYVEADSSIEFISTTPAKSTTRKSPKKSPRKSHDLNTARLSSTTAKDSQQMKGMLSKASKADNAPKKSYAYTNLSDTEPSSDESLPSLLSFVNTKKVLQTVSERSANLQKTYGNATSTSVSSASSTSTRQPKVSDKMQNTAAAVPNPKILKSAPKTQTIIDLCSSD